MTDGTIHLMTDPSLPVATPPAGALSAGKQALGRHAWLEAFDLLSSADRDGNLTGPSASGCMPPRRADQRRLGQLGLIGSEAASPPRTTMTRSATRKFA